MVRSFRRSFKSRTNALVLVALLVCSFFIGSKFRVSSGHTAITISEELLLVYDFRPGFYEPNHLDPINVTSDLVTRKELLQIDDIHLQGLVHSGAWIFIVDSNSRLLVMRRGPQLVTCPNMWSLVGEHRLGREQPSETPVRGIEEELGSDILRHVQFIEPLTPQPLYYFRDYGPNNNGRIDRQVTWLWWVQLDKPSEVIQLHCDGEVSEHRWLSLKELEEWMVEEQEAIENGSEGLRLCHHTILSLSKVGLNLLLEKGVETKIL